MKKVVIVGGVAGGASLAARLRRLDETSEIIILERGPYISYANCGLPYYVGGVIKDKERLLLQTPERMKTRFNIDVRVRQEAVAIDREKQMVSVRCLDRGETYQESYDVLVLATGSSPLKPPIPGIDSPRIQSLWTVDDSLKLRQRLSGQSAVRRAAVIGGGFIGLETAENLREAGLEVSIIEMMDQVMAPLDFEMAQACHETLSDNGVQLILGDGVAAFEDQGQSVSITLKSGRQVEADLVLLAIGVRPNSELAKACGLPLNQRGGILTDTHLRTADPAIYAVGDVIDVVDLVQGGQTMIPLAGPANKQGRIAANNIVGEDCVYEGSIGTSVLKLFDLTIAATGANERSLQRNGLIRGKDYLTLTITQNSHATYYPGATPLTIKLIFAADGSKIFGAQIVGVNGVDKRIDTIATALRLQAPVSSLAKLELAYAPPFSSAKDPVNMAGFVAQNILEGKIELAPWDVLEQAGAADWQILDVREDAELLAFELPRAQHIPLGQLRQRLGELNPDRPVLVFCAVGVRAYNGARILLQQGFKRVAIYPGGTRFYQTAHFKLPQVSNVIAGDQSDPLTASRPVAVAPKTAGVAADLSDTGEGQAVHPLISMKLDCSGLQCPGPIMKVFETMQTLAAGQVLEVGATDPGFVRDIQAWCRRTGNELLSQSKQNGLYVARLRKGGASLQSAAKTGRALKAEGKTLIVFSNDLDRVLASFIIANGAAAMGRPVTMFFTFWGLTVLRKPQAQGVKKTFIESMFGHMLPRGSQKLKLSKLNLGGMGTVMMKKIMADKHVSSLEELIQQAIKAGVKIVACTMSMDIMGIKAEELIDGVELGGVGSYLGDAEEADVNLFIS
ncbi:FAD-dependent oxidoreductase [Oscillospiraceae bacterium HV4-5-C5C]|nr:FAD-dependent oxidoreductase [Oscillospiraceae bacterium HV4-5-C5C]